MAARFGDVATRLSVLGGTGDRGADRDLLRVREPAAFRKSFDDGCRLHGVEGGGGFAASVRDLIATLITCVARAVLSLMLSSCFDWTVLAFELVGRVLPPVFDFVSFDVRRLSGPVFEELDEASVSHRSNSLIATIVVVVHVEVEAIAALAESTFVCNEAIIMCT